MATTTPTPTKWLVCIDETASGAFAFDAVERMSHKDEEIVLIHVGGKSSGFFDSDYKNEDEVKKVLVFYGLKAQQKEMKVTLVGCASGPAYKRINQAVKDFQITNIIIGRRPANLFRSLTTTSTSKSILESVECNVTVSKPPPGVDVQDEKAFRGDLDKQDTTLLAKVEGEKGVPHKGRFEFVHYILKDSKEKAKETVGETIEVEVKKTVVVDEYQPKEPKETVDKKSKMDKPKKETKIEKLTKEAVEKPGEEKVVVPADQE